jgi:four helix bundle protein
MSQQKFNLEDRLLDYAAEIIRLVDRLSHTRAGNHIAAQILRSGTSPLPNHGEAQAAESKNDFIHKMSICFKELRETRRWLRLIQRIFAAKLSSETGTLLSETEELLMIFSASIKTARKRAVGS